MHECKRCMNWCNCNGDNDSVWRRQPDNCQTCGECDYFLDDTNPSFFDDTNPGPPYDNQSLSQEAPNTDNV